MKTHELARLLLSQPNATACIPVQNGGSMVVAQVSDVRVADNCLLNPLFLFEGYAPQEEEEAQIIVIS